MASFAGWGEIGIFMVVGVGCNCRSPRRLTFTMFISVVRSSRLSIAGLLLPEVLFLNV